MEQDKVRPKILFVDDIPMNIKVLVEALKEDYKVIFAQSGPEALDFAQNDSQPDLILLDIMMPNMDGYEVCQRLKENEKTRHIPVIFVTALDEEDDETRGLAQGAVDFIRKPFSLPIVRARIKTHLDLKLYQDRLKNQTEELALANARLEEEIQERRKAEEMIREHLTVMQEVIQSHAFPASQNHNKQ